MRHLDLFSGIGGFAYALDQVYDDVEHIFCDNDPFCQAVLKKHWPEARVYDDIRAIGHNAADPYGTRLQGKDAKWPPRDAWIGERVDVLTGGFPCQPFSEAGFRRGTADDRYLWPEMLRVIRLTKPTWVIAENVRGILTWNDGVVFEQVCLDLEAAGYEVQTFIIPAVAVNAPHRRDRVWFVAKDAHGQRTSGGGDDHTEKLHRQVQNARPDWNRHWHEVATELCSVDDGLPARVGGLELTKAQHRDAQIKAYGNAIVPQVAEEIMKAIKEATK